MFFGLALIPQEMRFTMSNILKLSIFCLVFITATVVGEQATQETLVWQQTSEQGLFNVTLDSQVENAVEINEFLEWILTVESVSGEAVSPARITVGGGMPAHGHGLPTQPQVSEYLGEGKYLVKGLKFSMNGRWELSFDIQSEDHRDKVVFDLKIDY